MSAHRQTDAQTAVAVKRYCPRASGNVLAHRAECCGGTQPKNKTKNVFKNKCHDVPLCFTDVTMSPCVWQGRQILLTGLPKLIRRGLQCCGGTQPKHKTKNFTMSPLKINVTMSPCVLQMSRCPPVFDRVCLGVRTNFCNTTIHTHEGPQLYTW